MFSDTFSRSIRVGLLVSATFPGIKTYACSLTDDNTGQNGSDIQHGSDDAGNPSDRQAQWIYVSIPRHGIATLQSVLEPGSRANIAWLDVGEPFESYTQVPLIAPNPNIHSGASVLLILPERCLGDFNNNGGIDLDDVAIFTVAYINQDPIADLSRDGQVDLRDQIVFLQLATIPCHSAW